MTEWRYLPFEYYHPHYKTGLNQALIEAVDEGKSRPTVFLCGWKPGCVNLGRSQVFEEEVNVDRFRDSEYVLVRRQGGGGATLLTEKGEITWGIVGRKEDFADDINTIYENVCGFIAEGLEEIGIDAWHEPINDIVTDNGKISGSTIKQQGDVVYIGGTLIFEVDAEEMFSILTPDEDKLKDKQIESFRERVTSISDETNLSFEETVDALKNILLQDKKYEVGEISDFEDGKAKEYSEKYSKDKWLYNK